MKMKGGPTSVNLKLILLIIAFVIAGGTLFYTQNLVNKLQERETNIVELYASSLKYIATSGGEAQDYTFIFDIIRKIDFPLILTDANNNTNLNGLGSGVRNIEIDTTLSPKQIQKFLSKKIKELRGINQPIVVTLPDSTVIQKIFYGESSLIKKLRFYPYFQIISAMFFILIAYISFSYVKKNEQSNIWVGMAKETAHQLGTPISSLLGWTEILKMHPDNPDKVIDVADEMNSDLIRLNKVAQRFSKIGSKPELKKLNVYNTVANVSEYFQRRLPQTGKKISLKISGDKSTFSMLNAELFEWVLENLIKNALDAIEKGKEGEIRIDIFKNDDTIDIDVSDNGKGIDVKQRKDVFRPGYSTKQRGWGLGLSLAKRIVENYHKGKIFVLRSEPGAGTTFRISLENADENIKRS